MRFVNISDLKARLSAHIQMVREGEEVLVCDRNKPVARIVPCLLEDQPERERQPEHAAEPEREPATRCEPQRAVRPRVLFKQRGYGQPKRR